MVKINEAHHPSGIPAVGDGISISFDSVTIKLSRKDYEDMVAQISENVSKDLKTLTDRYDKYYERVEKVNALVVKIREAFYDVGDSDYAVKKSVDEIDWKNFDEILEQNTRLLGFE